MPANIACANASTDSISPETVSFLVLGEGNDVDVWTYRQDGFGDPTPIQSSENDSLADSAFVLRAADLARVTSLVRESPRRVGIADSHVTSVSLSKDGEALEFRLDVASAHRRGSARFDAAGVFVDARVD